MPIAEYVGGIQYAANLTDEAMADHFGIEVGTYLRFLEGAVPSAPLQLVIQQGLELGPDEFDRMYVETKRLDLREFILRSVTSTLEARALDNRSLGLTEGDILTSLLRSVGVK